MNIALFYESVLPKRGGCETYIASLAQRLVQSSHEVHLYANRWDQEALPESLHYHQVSMGPSLRITKPWQFGWAAERARRGQTHDVTLGFDKMWGVDVVYPQGGLHVSTMEHNLLKYSSPLKRALLSLVRRVDPANRSFTALERKIFLGPNRPLVVAISEMVYRQFQEVYHLSANDLRLVPLATNRDRFEEYDRPRQRLELREEWRVPADSTVALFIGMNYRLKGLEPLLRAVKLLADNPSFFLCVAGGSKYGEFERLARKLDVLSQVRFLGYRSDIRKCYFASDFLVHPTFYDPCSNVVLEAMTCGLPVITSRYNGASEFIKPSVEGYVVDDPHDHAHLAWALRQLIDPVRRSACGRAARQVANGWTFDQHFSALCSVFEEAAARRRAA